MSNPNKSDEQYLAEVAHWPQILKMRIAILGDIALQKQGLIKPEVAND